MQYRKLGGTNLRVSAISFGAGPVSALMTGPDADLQRRCIERAIELGVNWFDTAATYGDGNSERGLGAALAALGSPSDVHVATKVRLLGSDLDDIPAAIRKSLEASLARLQLSSVTLLQLHNSITPHRGDEPTSITPADVLGRSGVCETFERLRSAGLVSYLGLTGLGSRDSLGQVVSEGCFDTVQLPYHLLNPSADESVPAGLPDTDYGNIIDQCQLKNMGVFAIRVFAAGALAEREPSAHTHKTAFFPLALYERDRRRAARLAKILPDGMTLKEAAVRFVLGNPRITSAIIGFGAPHELDEVVRLAEAGPLDEPVLAIIRQSRIEDSMST